MGLPGAVSGASKSSSGSIFSDLNFSPDRVDEALNINNPVSNKPVSTIPTKLNTPVSLHKSPINPQTGKPVTWIDPCYNTHGKDFPPYSG